MTFKSQVSLVFLSKRSAHFDNAPRRRFRHRSWIHPFCTHVKTRCDVADRSDRAAVHGAVPDLRTRRSPRGSWYSSSGRASDPRVAVTGDGRQQYLVPASGRDHHGTVGARRLVARENPWCRHFVDAVRFPPCFRLNLRVRRAGPSDNRPSYLITLF